MSGLTQNRWFRRLGFGAIAALSLCAVTSLSPAQAHEYGHRTPAVAAHHVSFVSRFFYGFGGHHWDHRDHYRR